MAKMETETAKVETEALEKANVIEVDPVEEGPVLVKPKRQLTGAQLEVLKKGREKLAEKRAAAAVGAEPSENSYQLCVIV